MITARDFSPLRDRVVGFSRPQIDTHLTLYHNAVDRLNAIEAQYPMTDWVGPAPSTGPDGLAALLDKRICDLDLAPTGPIVDAIETVAAELHATGLWIPWAPYIGDGEFWASDRAIAVNIPWFLANPTLWRLANRSEATAYTLEQVLKCLRHEAGHVFNYSYELWKTPAWQAIFGDFLEPYRDQYPIDPESRRYVDYGTPTHYAQKHPDEDWAETFARWLDRAGVPWSEEFADWPAALAKLHFVDETIQRLRAAGNRPSNLFIGRPTSYRSLKWTVRQALGAPPMAPQFSPAGWSEHGELLRQESAALNAVVLHELFFEALCGPSSPPSRLIELASANWGSWDAYLRDLRIACGTAKSGWALTVWDPRRQQLRNALMESDAGAPAGCPVMLAIDLYEHAYAQDYGARKDLYLAAVFENLHWGCAFARVAGVVTSSPADDDLLLPEFGAGPSGQQKFARAGLVQVEREVTRATGKSHKQHFWVKDSDVKRGDRVLKSVPMPSASAAPEHHDPVAALLATASPVRDESLGEGAKGINVTHRMHFDDTTKPPMEEAEGWGSVGIGGAAPVVGYFKPAAGETPARETIPAGEYYHRETAAYALDQALGIGLVPRTIVRDDPKYGIGSIQQAHPGVEHADRKTETESYPTFHAGTPSTEIAEVANREAFQRLRVLDIVAGNSDRHSGNWMRRYNEKGELVPAPIDHGLCFPVTVAGDVGRFRAPEVDNPTVHGPVEPAVRKMIEAADYGHVADAIAPHLDPESTHATLVRLAVLKEHPEHAAYSLDANHADAGQAAHEAQKIALVLAKGYVPKEENAKAITAAMTKHYPEWKPKTPDEMDRLLDDIVSHNQMREPSGAEAEVFGGGAATKTEPRVYGGDAMVTTEPRK